MRFPEHAAPTRAGQLESRTSSSCPVQGSRRHRLSRGYGSGLLAMWWLAGAGRSSVPARPSAGGTTDSSPCISPSCRSLSKAWDAGNGGGRRKRANSQFPGRMPTRCRAICRGARGKSRMRHALVKNGEKTQPQDGHGGSTQALISFVEPTPYFGIVLGHVAVRRPRGSGFAPRLFAALNLAIPDPMPLSAAGRDRGQPRESRAGCSRRYPF